MPKYRVKDENKIQSVTMNIRSFNNQSIQVGVFGSDDSFQVMKATVHEFGAKIKVSPKQRAWFSYQGFPLKASTTEIVIPERSFLRSTFDTKSKVIEDMSLEEIHAVMMVDRQGKKAADRLGLRVAALVQETMTELKKPDLSGMTKERRKGKGEYNPLVDDGRMRQGITHNVKAR